MHFILIRKMPHLKEIFVVDISDKKKSLYNKNMEQFEK